MGWFDEQIRQRIAHDDDAFADAFAAMSAAVMGESLTRALEDDRIRTKNAIDEILKYYNEKPADLPEDIQNVNDQLEYLLRPCGIMRRTVELEEGWYKDSMGALLGVLSASKEPVALLPYGLSGYHYYDTKTGKWIRLNHHTAGNIEREAVCFYKPLPLKKIGISDLIFYIIRCISKADLIFVGVAALFVSLLGLLTPRIQELIYGSVIENSDMRLFFAVFGFLICLNLSQLFIGVIQRLLLSRLETKMNIQVQAAGMMRLLSLPPSFFKEYASGELANRMNCINTLCTMLANAILSTGLTSAFSLIYITQMVHYGPGLVIPGLLVIVCTVVVSIGSLMVQLRVAEKKLTLSAEEAGLEYAFISGIQKIRLAGAEKRAFSKWAHSYAEHAKLEYNPPDFLGIPPEVISGCISLVGTIVIYYYTIKTSVPLADYFAFNSAYGMVTGAFTALIGMISTFAMIRPVLDLARPILETVPEMSEDKKMVTRLFGGIELNNVSFRYGENDPLILDNLSLKIRPGQYVAVVGSTGCGKSTLMRLMLGFERPQKGAIYYDGKDLATLDLKSLRQHIGSVMQDGKLFQGDIFSNIIISAPQLTMKEAWEAAEMAGIADDIRAMPMGMHTLISGGGGGISGGQRQRLLIARAIAAKPRILMFDEATSALDNITQKIVSDSLESLKCTRIVIAHRLSTIRHCDRIIVLDKGKIIEEGTYEELLEQEGFFAELVSRQRLDVS